MPIYEYQAAEPAKGCEQCGKPFEQLQRMSDPPLAACPKCGARVTRLISAPNVGGSRASFDDRARNAGFHKLKKVSKGEYETKY